MTLNKNVAKVLVLVLIIAAFSIGCTPARRPIVDRNNNTADRNNDVGLTNPNTLPGQNTAPGTVETDPNGYYGNDRNEGMLGNDGNLDLNGNNNMNNTMNDMRDTRIADEVKQIDGVEDAVVLMNDNTAYIGLDLDRNIEGERSNDIEDEVIRRVKAMDRNVDTVYVSSDIDAFGRLQGFGRDIRAGRPVTGFIDEIEEMFRRPMPRS